MAGELDEMIRRLRGLAHLEDRILPEVARELETIIGENIAAQRGPDGKAWPVSPGGPVLLGAMKNITIKVIGRVVLIRVVGPEARHHLGLGRGRVQRMLIPTARLPGPMTEAIRRVAARKTAEVLSGGV